MTQGQIDYEKTVKIIPNYDDGTPRKKWSELSDLAKYSWNKINHRSM